MNTYIWIFVLPHRAIKCFALQWTGIFKHFIPSSHNSLPFFALLAIWSAVCKEVYFCSFVTKSNQASTRYWPDVFSSFYRMATHGESHRILTSPPQTRFPHISLYELFFLLPPHFFLHYNPPNLPQTIHKISIGPDKAPHTLFFCFKQNSRFRDSPPSISQCKSRRHMNPVASD